jgi:hypothetical protein
VLGGFPAEGSLEPRGPKSCPDAYVRTQTGRSLQPALEGINPEGDDGLVERGTRGSVADEARVLGSDAPEGERELMTPSVRPLRPESHDIRSRSGGAGSGSSSAKPDAPSSPRALAATERQRQAELKPAFQRRWEVVQTVFVARGR